MRNIIEYPVTYKEKLEVLELCQKLLRAYVGDAVGGIQEYALSLVVKEFKGLDGET